MSEAIRAAMPEIQHILFIAPRYLTDRGIKAWEGSFAARQRSLRTAIESLPLDHRGARYSGSPGEHELTLAGVTARSDDGYAGLLRTWLQAASARVAAEEGGAQ